MEIGGNSRLRLGHCALTSKDPTALSGFYERFLGLHRVGEVATEQPGAMVFLSTEQHGPPQLQRRQWLTALADDLGGRPMRLLTPWWDRPIVEVTGETRRRHRAPRRRLHGGGAMERSLFERLGGIDAITAVVEDFRDRVAGDDRINLKFARTDLGRLRKMLIDQVCEATGGPCQYRGRSMKEAHAAMKVTKGEFNALVDDLVATLNQFKVPSAEQDELLAILGPLQSDIVEVDSSEIGTALPDAFQPAPALMT